MNTTQQGERHLCIKKEDGLYINGAKCTDGFIEGKEYSESEFKIIYEHQEVIRDGVGGHYGLVWTEIKKELFDKATVRKRKSAILLPALKEDSGEEQLQAWDDAFTEAPVRVHPFTEKWFKNHYTITKK